MLNKELLLNKPKPSKDWTHIMRVSSREGDEFGYAYGSHGSISPETAELYGIVGNCNKLCSYIQSGTTELSLYYGVSYKGKPIYIGRSDTKQSFGSYTDTTSHSFIWDGLFVSSADKGKEIPIWIGDTPPPYD